MTRRADRLFRIVEALRRGRLVTAGELAGRMEVSRRTIYRDMADLMASGLPIDGEAGVGYVMRAGYDLPPMTFDRDEVAALITGARLVQAWGGAAMAQAAIRALERIEASLPPDMQGIAERTAIHAFRMPGLDSALRDRLDRLDRSIAGRRALILDYADGDGATSRRRVHPLGLQFWGKVWTLAAWCELRDDFRMFRLDRIVVDGDAGPFETEDGRTLADFYARECARRQAAGGDAAARAAADAA